MSEREEPSLSISESASLERGYRRLLAWYLIAMAAFFGLTTMTMIEALSAGSPVYAPADFAAGLVIWFISLVSMVLVFTPARPGRHTRFCMRNTSSMA
jgi:hypothetical protein